MGIKINNTIGREAEVTFHEGWDHTRSAYLSITDTSDPGNRVSMRLNDEEREALIAALRDGEPDVAQVKHDVKFNELHVGDRIRVTKRWMDGDSEVMEGEVKYLNKHMGSAITKGGRYIAEVEYDGLSHVTVDILERVPEPPSDWARDKDGDMWWNVGQGVWKSTFIDDLEVPYPDLVKDYGPLTFMEMIEKN